MSGSAATIAEAADARVARRTPQVQWARVLGPRNISAVYLLAGIIIFFSIQIPDTFLTDTTFKTIMAREAVTGIVALGLTLSLAAGVFDLSIGGALGLAGVMAGWMEVKQGAPLWLACLVALVLGVLIGVTNGFMVVKLRIDSFIATLAMGAVLIGVTVGLAGGQQITGLSQGFKDIAQNEFLGLSWSVFYLLALALVLWYVTEHTPTGRYLYATGGGKDAARLAGVRTNRYVFGALVCTSVIAAFAGIVEASTVSSASKDVGATFVLPAFAAAFLGSTQFKGGRFNIWGTWLAVYVVATGVKGLELWTQKFWLKDIFYGAVLAVAVGIASYEGRARVEGTPPWWRRRPG